MLRISDLDWPRILFTRSAGILLGVAALLSLAAVFINHSNFNFDALSPGRQECLTILGAASAMGFFVLPICMGFFWLKCDSSSKISKTIWFLILLLGFMFGSAVLYYVAVYLPALTKRLQNEGPCEIDIQPTEANESRNRLGPFRRLLLVIWAVVVLPVFLVLSLARIPTLFAGIAAIAFFVWSVIVILEAILHWILSLYRSGVSRSPRSNGSDSSGRKNRD